MRTILSTHNIPVLTTRGLLLRKNQSKTRKNIQATITLTSLIDAFVIIVLYLVVCNSPSDATIDLEDQLTLPQAKIFNQIDDSPVITFKNNHFFIEGKQINDSDLNASLKRISSSLDLKIKNKEASIILQADEKIDFHKLQPFLTASAHAGIKNVKFAVYQQE